MERCCKYLYKIELPTTTDVVEFNKAATRIPGKVYLVNGDKKLNAKSFLGVHLARLSWDEIYVECEGNCRYELRKFIV